jgi:Iap family predicted aminopeptidase
VPLRAGYPIASIGSVNEHMVPSNYHWPTDTPDRVDYDSVAGAVELVAAAAERLAAA